MFKRVFIFLLLLMFITNAHAGLTTDLVSYYNFDEASGDLIDQVASNDGTNSNVTQDQTGIIDKAYSYNGSSSYTNLGSSHGLQASAGTYSIWFKKDSGTGIRFLVSTAHNDVAPFTRYYIYLNDNELRMRLGEDSEQKIDDISNNTWYHVVVTWDSGSYTGYLNGVSKVTSTFSGSSPDNELQLGKLFSINDFYFNGKLDEVAIYSRAITSDEISDLYNSGSGLTYPFITESVDANFDYDLNYDTMTATLTDTSTVIGDTNIESWAWTLDGASLDTNQNTSFTFEELTDYNVGLFVDSNVDDVNDIIYQTISIGDLTPPETSFSSTQVSGTTDQNIILTCTDNNSGCQYINFSINGGDYNYYTIGDNPLSIIYSGVGDHNISYFSTDNSDNNESINTSYFTTYGKASFEFFTDTDDSNIGGTTYTITPSINGDSGGYLTISTLDLNLQGISETDYTFTFENPDYTSKTMVIPLNQLSNIDYNIGFIETSLTEPVAFQVFDLTGNTKPNTKFYSYDNDNGFLIEIKTTDSLGKMTMNLNNTKSDYNFYSDDLNFGVTTWTINKPKDATTLTDISGDWKYSITGASYSSETNIASNVTKLLLQNTVNPYYIKIQDVNETYAETSFGLQSTTVQTTRTLNPYLYPLGSADLVIIKLLDFTTNQPISEAYELNLSVYTDSNGLIPIGTFINDSTGTYNIYMDANEQYRLEINESVYELRPTLSIYYLYIVSNIGIVDTGDVPDINTSFVPEEIPPVFGEVREYFFGCADDGSDCYPSMVFSLISIVILSIGLVGLVQAQPLAQTIITIILLGGFTFIGFMPLWLFGITLVISLAWGVYSL